MKIIHVYNHFHPCIGGIEKHMEDLCTGLIKAGHESDVCCLNRCAGSKEKLESHEKYRGINIFRIPYKDLKYYKIAPKVLGLIKKYDVIHIHGLGFFFDFLTSTKRIHKKPIILSTHGGIFHTKKLMTFKKIYFSLWSKRKLKQVDKIIAVSRNDEKLFSKISKKVTFIPNGIQHSEYSKIKRTPDSKTMLFIGRVSQNKRIDRLIHLISELKEMGKTFRLHVAGSDKDGEIKKLEGIVKRSDLEKQVIFLGPVSEKDKLKLLSRTELFVSASEYEGFGISVLEAMATGVPVLVNDIEAFRNFVSDGNNGFIFDFSKSRDLAAFVSNINRNALLKVSKNAKISSKDYDWKNIIKKIVVIYEKSSRTL